MNQEIFATTETKRLIFKFKNDMIDFYKTRPKTFLVEVEGLRFGFFKCKRKVLDTAAIERFSAHPGIIDTRSFYRDDEPGERVLMFTDLGNFARKTTKTLNNNNSFILVGDREIELYRYLIEVVTEPLNIEY